MTPPPRSVLLLVAALAVGCGPRFRGTVSLVPEEAPVSTGEARIHPPDCGLPDPPAYPAKLVDRGLPPLRVRVSFLLSDEGLPSEVHGSTESTLQEAATFVRAAEEAVAAWHCYPAGRMPGPDEPPEFIPLPYRTRVTFLFDAERIGRRASIVAPGKEGGGAVEGP